MIYSKGEGEDPLQDPGGDDVDGAAAEWRSGVSARVGNTRPMGHFGRGIPAFGRQRVLFGSYRAPTGAR